MSDKNIVKTFNSDYAKTDSDGKHWDKDGNYLGRTATGDTTKEGHHYDKDGNYVGHTSPNTGQSYDKYGNEI